MDSGAYHGTKTTQLSSSVPGCTIRYTTDGSTPTTTHGTIYTKAVSISKTTTLKAVAYKNGAITSPASTDVYVILPH